MEIWQVFIIGGVCFFIGFWFGAWVQKQEDPVCETEKSLNEKIARRLMQDEL